MESAAIVKMVTEGPSKGYVVDWVVSNDDSTMRAHLRHQQPDEAEAAEPAQGRTRKRQRINASDKGQLPKWIWETVLKANPNHQNKVVACKFFDLAKKGSPNQG